jgi:hypothetical protein
MRDCTKMEIYNPRFEINGGKTGKHTTLKRKAYTDEYPPSQNRFEKGQYYI